MLSICFSVWCIKVVAGMIGGEWERGLKSLSLSHSLSLSAPWELGKDSKVRELGVIENGNVFSSFLINQVMSLNQEKKKQYDSLYCILKKSRQIPAFSICSPPVIMTTVSDTFVSWMLILSPRSFSLSLSTKRQKCVASFKFTLFKLKCMNWWRMACDVKADLDDPLWITFWLFVIQLYVNEVP